MLHWKTILWEYEMYCLKENILECKWFSFNERYHNLKDLISVQKTFAFTEKQHKNVNYIVSMKNIRMWKILFHLKTILKLLQLCLHKKTILLEYKTNSAVI